MERRTLLIFADSARTDCKTARLAQRVPHPLGNAELRLRGEPRIRPYLFTSRGCHRQVSSSFQIRFQESLFWAGKCDLVPRASRLSGVTTEMGVQ